MYAYKDIVEWMEASTPTVNTLKLREVLLDEEVELYTPTDGDQVIEAEDEDNKETEVYDVELLNAIVPFVSSPLSTVWF